MDELKALIQLLREQGVVKYEGLDSLGERVVLELGPLPAGPPAVDLTAEGRPLPKRSAELQAALARLDPRYSDEALFSIVEAKR